MTQRWKRKIVCVMVFVYAFSLTVPFPVALAAERKSTVYIGSETLAMNLRVCDELEKLDEVIAIHLREGRMKAHQKFVEYFEKIGQSGFPQCFVVERLAIIITEKYRQLTLEQKAHTVIKFEVIGEGSTYYGVITGTVEYPPPQG